jgi:hypothetical protein
VHPLRHERPGRDGDNPGLEHPSDTGRMGGSCRVPGSIHPSGHLTAVPDCRKYGQAKQMLIQGPRTITFFRSVFFKRRVPLRRELSFPPE